MYSFERSEELDKILRKLMKRDKIRFEDLDHHDVIYKKWRGRAS